MVKKKAKVKRKKATKRQRDKETKKQVTKKRQGTKASKAKIKKQALEVSLEKIGEVTHYFPHVKAAAVMLLKSGLKVGDNIYIKGHTTDFKETVKSIQLDRVPIQEGKKGQEIGLLVKSRVRQGDSVYRI
jgi:putative protease